MSSPVLFYAKMKKLPENAIKTKNKTIKNTLIS